MKRNLKGIVLKDEHLRFIKANNIDFTDYINDILDKAIIIHNINKTNVKEVLNQFIQDHEK